MKAFAYVNPANEKEAVAALKTDGIAMVIGGGQDLLARMKDYIDSPDLVVNIKGLDATIAATPDGGMKIGSAVKIIDLFEHALVAKLYPAVVHAAGEVGTPQIRNQGTVGGNVNQRPRCWYFRNGLGLLPKDESGKDLVTDGENQYHAILGNDGPAKFVSPSTIVPVLIAYNATVRLEGPKGKRELPLAKFYVIPKTEDEREHDLRPNEIVTEILVPPAEGWKVAHYEVRQKAAFDWPLAVAAVALKTDGSTVQSARVVLGHVAPVPWPSPEAESALKGQSVSEESAQKAAAASVSNARPLSRNAHKVHLAQVAVKRAILKAGGAA